MASFRRAQCRRPTLGRWRMPLPAGALPGRRLLSEPPADDDKLSLRSAERVAALSFFAKAAAACRQASLPGAALSVCRRWICQWLAAGLAEGCRTGRPARWAPPTDSAAAGWAGGELSAGLGKILPAPAWGARNLSLAKSGAEFGNCGKRANCAPPPNGWAARATDRSWRPARVGPGLAGADIAAVVTCRPLLTANKRRRLNF